MTTSPGFRDLRVYQLAFRLATEIFNDSKLFPHEEKYSLTDQVRHASRSVAEILERDLARSNIPKCL